MATKRPYCLTIAGFDPSGGAGVIADCKTFEQFRTQGLSVITANTIQTEDAYFQTHWIAEAVILDQLGRLLERYPVKHFKIGLIENGTVLKNVLDCIYQHVEQPFIVWDPILSATAGSQFSEERFGDLAAILPRINRMTPNYPEFKALFGEADPAAIATPFQTGIYLKGGHSEQEKGTDRLYLDGKQYPFRPKVNTKVTKHGTGCVLSAALTATQALGYPVVKGALKSKRYLEYVLTSNSSLLGFHKR